MNIHPAAALFPMLSPERLAELAADIHENGLREAIVMLNGVILDGRNRHRACEMAGITPQFRHVPADTNPWLFVWSLNGQRRDLNNDQRYIIWEKCSANDNVWQAEREAIADEANRKRSEAATAGLVGRAAAKKAAEPEFSDPTTCGATKPQPIENHTEKPKVSKSPAAEKKAAAAGVDRGTVERNDWLKKHRPDLHKQVENGLLTASKAQSIAKKEERAADIAAQKLAIEDGTAKLPEGVFEVVCMDPPWNYGRDYDPDGSRVANPYPEMTQEQLIAMQPPFADEGVLFLWTTHQFIWDAKTLMDHWGFAYKASLVWDKERLGLGAWFRMQCEFCLVGIKGNPSWTNTTWRDVIREPRREHSRKPEAFYAMVESVTVGRRLDFFSREGRAGWEAFGNDSAKF